jgi:predicted DNA-binding transcriptional regulator AlpA
LSADFLTLNATAERTGLSRRELLRRRQAGRFPPAVELAARFTGNVRAVLFRATEVDAWLKTHRPGALPDPFDY